MRVPTRWSNGWGWTLGLGLALAASAASQAAQTTPGAAEVLDRLRAGNASFASSPDGFLPISIERRSSPGEPPAPMAAVLSCADARVPPEIIFHAGLGDLFVVRTVGHVTDRSVLASLEYAAEQLEVPLIVVVGHEACGAVQTAVDTPPAASLGANLDYLVRAIRPATAGLRPDEASALRQAILGNVEETINRILDGSSILRRRAGSGSLALVGAYYELGTGRAHFSDLVQLTPTDAGSSQ